MARKSLDASVKTHRDNTEKQNNERFDKLHEESTGLFADILDDVFPYTDNDQPDWKKFNWDRAEQLKTVLKQFADRKMAEPTPHVHPDETQRPRQSRREPARDTGNGESVTVIRPDQPAPAPARTTVVQPATPAAPRPATPAPAPAKKGWVSKFKDQLNS